MHPLKPLLLIGISAVATTAENDSACSPVSTILVTLTASPIAQVTLTAITKTVTVAQIATQVISVIQTSLPAEGQAAYSFTEDNGTTTWLGATPPASASLITSTRIVNLEPVTPGYVPPTAEVTPVTSYLTLSSTETVTEIHTETQTLNVPIAYASAGAYPGLASNGWNSSLSKFITLKSPNIGSVTIAEKVAHYSGTAYPMISSGIMPFSPGNTTRHNKARDIPDIVIATIDGVVVSWTNQFDGTPDTSQTSVPVAAAASQTEPKSSSISSTSPLQSNISLTSSSTAAAATPSCGDTSAEFIIDFDDLPAFSSGPGDTDIPPIFNPYHKLFFQEYFGYVPPPSDPFPPISPPQLAVYRANGSGTIGSPDGGLEMKGEIGSGPRAAESAYWIDAYSAYLGCTNAGPDDCSIVVKGYQNSSFFSIISQGFTLPPCPGMKNCSLALVEFADGFRGLTGLQIIATVGTTSVDWYMDNLSLGWSNNTCAAQLERSSQE